MDAMERQLCAGLMPHLRRWVRDGRPDGAPAPDDEHDQDLLDRPDSEPLELAS